jgi:translation initiation factor IF-3
MISPDASPPVCRIIDFSKFRYEQARALVLRLRLCGADTTARGWLLSAQEQKVKEAKKKMAASRQEQKELKMRCAVVATPPRHHHPLPD